jgi:predicted transposase YbfD/YdcC
MYPMSGEQYTTLLEALKDVPDPRKARGKRYTWTFLLALICGALACGQKTPHAIAHWIQLLADEILEYLRPPRDSMPSESTIRRTLRAIAVGVLEEQLARFAPSLAEESPATGTITTSTGETWQGQAVDGKELRGVRAHGQRVCLLSLVQHGSGITLAQRAVEKKSNDITAVPQLLEGRDLSGTVTTMDALLTQRSLAQQILDQGGHYLMIVKQNQPKLYEAIALLFERPPWLRREQDQAYRVHRTVDKGHGRLETRILETSNMLCDYLDWPGVGQVLRRRCQRVNLKTGEVSTQTTYGLTSLPWSQVDAAQIEALWRGHWTIENRVHYVRDVTMGEDACQMRTGHAPQVLAALRNIILSLFRWQGWTNIADALRYYAACFRRSLELIGASPGGL